MPYSSPNPFHLARIARAGLRGIERQKRRGNNQDPNKFMTPFGEVTRTPFRFEKVSWAKTETPVEMITTRQQGEFKGTKGRWGSYASFIKYVTPQVAEDVNYQLELLDEKSKTKRIHAIKPLNANEKRAAAMLYGLGRYSEHQRSGNRKWMRGVLRAIAKGKMTAAKAFDSDHAGFIQASKGGLKKLRNILQHAATPKRTSKNIFNSKAVEIGVDEMSLSSGADASAEEGPMTRSRKRFRPLSRLTEKKIGGSPDSFPEIETYREELLPESQKNKRRRIYKN
jgi:hypothetical protein